jgi:putative sigma-54 modulation protein
MEELATEPHQEGDHEIKVIPAEPTPVKPLSLEDAAAELSKTDMGFLLFRNAESDCITVIYRRKDGHFSYIEAK